MGFKRFSTWIILGAVIAGSVVFLKNKYRVSDPRAEVSAEEALAALAKSADTSGYIPKKPDESTGRLLSSVDSTGESSPKSPSNPNREIARKNPSENTPGGFMPRPKLDRVRKSHVTAEFSQFENYHRTEIPKSVPELEGWSILPELSLVEETTSSDGKVLKYRGMKFKASMNSSTLQQFRGPIAIILPETKTIAVITGRIAVLHKSNVDRARFASEHGLRLDSAPDNSRAASYVLASSQSLIEARNSVGNDPRVQIAEIELHSGGVSK